MPEGKKTASKKEGMKHAKKIEGLGNLESAGECVCPICGISIPHLVGLKCYQQQCPKCGNPLKEK